MQRFFVELLNVLYVAFYKNASYWQWISVYVHASVHMNVYVSMQLSIQQESRAAPSQACYLKH